jgi:endonuclease VIII
MPEGDTVYRVAQQQHAALAGKELTGFEVRMPRFATSDLTGQVVHEVVSRGKHLLHRIGDYTLHTHLKMEGMWRLFAPGQPWRQPAFQARAVLTTASVVSVGFELGITELVRRDEEHTVVGYLGPDLLGPDWDAAEAIRRMSASLETPVFVALLDQRNLAGIGNEFANELCFVRGLLPTTPVREVKDLPALMKLAERMLQANKGRTTRSTTGDLRPGRTSWVHTRKGQPCRRCGTRLLGAELGPELQKRQVAWCPNCQR